LWFASVVEDFALDLPLYSLKRGRDEDSPHLIYFGVGYASIPCYYDGAQMQRPILRKRPVVCGASSTHFSGSMTSFLLFTVFTEVSVVLSSIHLTRNLRNRMYS